MTKRQKIDMSREIRQWVGILVPAVIFAYNVYKDKKNKLAVPYPYKVNRED